MEDVSRYHALLKDPTRRKIIELLGERGKIGFKELRSLLGLGVGTVYYHLDMLSDFIVQDKSRKYSLNNRGQLLYRSMKEGVLPPTLETATPLSSKIGRWIFLTPVFLKTVNPEKILPLSIAIIVFGGIGCAITSLEPFLFFYFPFSTYEFEKLAAFYLVEWISLFLFSDLLAYLIYRRVGGELQFFTCLGVASLPLAVFPYLTVFLSYDIARYILLILQIWTLLLLSAALSFGKGLRLDKSLVISLTAIYLNVVILVLIGKFP